MHRHHVHRRNSNISIYQSNLSKLLTNYKRINSPSTKIELLSDKKFCLFEKQQNCIQLTTFNVIRDSITYLSSYLIDIKIADNVNIVNLNLNSTFLFWSKRGFIFYDIIANKKVSQDYSYSNYSNSSLSNILYLNKDNNLLLLTDDGEVIILTG